MSSSGGQGPSSGGHATSIGQPPKKKVFPIKNPYASKKKKQNNNDNNIPRPQPPPPASRPANKNPPREMQAFGGDSFSQAFGGIEDTEYYARSVQENPLNNDTAEDTLERAQQRAIDEATDRDHHAMIQPHVLSVSTKQRGNGVLNYIRNVPFAYARMVPDYMMSDTSCALFLSCKYHSLHPNYIHRRIAELKTDFKTRILLLLVDIEDNASVLLFLNRLAVQQNFTLVLTWTEEEAARYLESYKALHGSDTSIIQRKEKTNFVDQATEFLSGAAGVNKTDAASLLTQFSNIRAIMAASQEELGLVPGLGQVKVKRLYEAFHKPFSSKRKREREQARGKATPEIELEAQVETKDEEKGSDGDAAEDTAVKGDSKKSEGKG